MRTIMDEIMGVKTMLPRYDRGRPNEYKRGLIAGLERNKIQEFKLFGIKLLN